jgi:hypothetical protein
MLAPCNIGVACQRQWTCKPSTDVRFFSVHIALSDAVMVKPFRECVPMTVLGGNADRASNLEHLIANLPILPKSAECDHT